MALAALCGNTETLTVRRRPLVAISSSGDELVPLARLLPWPAGEFKQHSLHTLFSLQAVKP